MKVLVRLKSSLPIIKLISLIQEGTLVEFAKQIKAVSPHSGTTEWELDRQPTNVSLSSVLASIGTQVL